jgi:hypothetical protein
MRTFICTVLSIVSFSIAVIGGAAHAEIPNRTPAQLRELASHIFTGKVLKIYSTVDSSSPKSEMIYSIAELQVAEVEKGEHKGRLAYVRFWKRRHLGDGPPQPGHYGHRGIPKVGAEARVYVMTEEDGGYDVLSPNGFAAVQTQRR